jgi:hypothetical protein
MGVIPSHTLPIEGKSNLGKFGSIGGTVLKMSILLLRGAFISFRNVRQGPLYHSYTMELTSCVMIVS